MSTRKMVLSTLYNASMAGVGIVCTVMCIRDLLRDNDAYLQCKRKVQKENWAKAANGDRASSE